MSRKRAMETARSSPPLVLTRNRSLFWLLTSGCFLVILCLHPFWHSRVALRTGDFCSHTLYLSLITVSLAALLWSGLHGSAKHVFWWPLLVSIACFCCVEGLKTVTRLPRPDHKPDGFPSGHTTFAYALAWLLTQTSPRLAPLWYGAALSIGWSRVEGQAHYPYQVFCGAVFGTVIGWGISHRFPGNFGAVQVKKRRDEA